MRPKATTDMTESHIFRSHTHTAGDALMDLRDGHRNEKDPKAVCFTFNSVMVGIAQIHETFFILFLPCLYLLDIQGNL